MGSMKIVFDSAGNLYGISGDASVSKPGTIFELTPSSSGWTEKIIYSFPGGSYGHKPSSLVAGRDGNCMEQPVLAAIPIACPDGTTAA